MPGLPAFFSSEADLVRSYFLSGSQAAATRTAAVSQIRGLTFFNLLPAAGVLSFGAVAAIIAGFRRQRWSTQFRLAARLWLLVAVEIVIWALALFEPNMTVIHQGIYLTELAAFAACVISLWEVSRSLCTVLVTLQVAVSILVYGVNGPSASAGAVHPRLDRHMALLALLGLVATGGALSLIASDDRTWRARARRKNHVSGKPVPAGSPRALADANT